MFSTDRLVLKKSYAAAICVIFVVACVSIGLGCWYGRGAQIVECSPDSGHSSGQTGGEDFLPGTAPWENLRLPSYTIPVHYDLRLYPDFYGDNAEFYGNVTIEIDIKQATRYLLVHIKKLNVKVTSVTDKESGQDYGVEKEWSYERNQFWVTKTKQVIRESRTVLFGLQFDGSLSNGIVGFYKAFYDNNTKAMATSKFEPVDARKAFPCFDEPNLKATFTITLIHKPDFTALSNTPAVEKRPSPVEAGLVETEFKKSVKMSTYLACFIVCNCTKVTEKLKSGKLFSVWAVEGREDQLDYALQVGVNATNFFEDYFGIPYPLDKMDMIAIPDFVSGAMEHWGLITYRETNLLYKPGVSSPSNKQRIAEVVSHELAHQWFGNIVTMDWWDDLWLNEGFATFMAYVGVEDVEPDMAMFSQFAPVEIFTVMPEDSVVSSHPIIVPVNRPEEITAVFDAISYNKGASVIRMMWAFVGEVLFKAGLTDYLKRYSYDNAKTYQLWESIGEVADSKLNINVRSIMDTWTKQSGFPLINIEVNEQTDSIKATQQHFVQNKSATWPESQFGYKWEVALQYITNNGGNHTNYAWLHTDGKPVEFPSPIDLSDSNNWIKFNKGATGYYMVNYSEFMWERLYSVLYANPEIMPAGDRASLVYDSLTLSDYGYLNYNTSMNFIKYMENETSYVPWSSAYSSFFRLKELLDSEEWKEFVVKLVAKAYNKVGWKTDGPHLDQLLSGIVIRLSCGHEYKECLDQAQNKFTQWLTDPEGKPINSIYRREVLLYGMTSITDEQWDKVWQLYMKEEVASAKVELRAGLARSRNQNQINKLLQYSMDKTKIPDQDFFGVMNSLAGNPVALPILWSWVGENYPAIVNRFGTEDRYLGRMVPYIAEQFSTAERLAQVEDFYEKYPEAGAGERARKQSLETIRAKMAWKQNYADSLTDWLNRNVNSAMLI